MWYLTTLKLSTADLTVKGKALLADLQIKLIDGSSVAVEKSKQMLDKGLAASGVYYSQLMDATGMFC